MLSGAGVLDGVKEGGVAIHAGVAFFLESLFHAIAEGAHGDGVISINGQILHAIGIFGDVIQLFGGTLAEGEFVVLVEAGDEHGFGGRVIDVTVAGFGIAGRPGVGLVVANVEPFFGADGADGVPGIVGIAKIVTFFGDEHCVASGVDGAGFIGLQDVEEALAGDGWGFGDAGDFENCRGEIASVDEVVDRAAGGNIFAPADGERDVEAVLVDLAFDAGEGHAMIGGDDDESVVEFAGLFEFGKDTAQVFVDPFDFQGVIEHVTAHDGVVGIILWHGDFGGIFAGADSGAVFVFPVRFLEAEPEAEGLIRGTLVEEEVEVVGVIDRADAIRWDFIPMLREGGTGGVVFVAGGLEIAGPPAFAGVPDEVAGFGEDVGVDGEIVGEDAHVVNGFFELPGVAASEDGGAAGAAFGVGCEGVMKEDAFAGDAIEVRSFDPFGAVGSGVAVAPVVGDDEENVRTFGLGLEGNGGEAELAQEIAALHRAISVSVGNAIKGAHTAGVIVALGFLKVLGCVHDEWAAEEERFFGGFTAEEDEFADWEGDGVSR